jgi:hypothetical protein
MRYPKPNLSYFHAILALAVTLSASNRGFAQQLLGDLHISQSSGRVLTSLRVAGSDPVPVVFDTGTSGNILDRKLAAKLGLPNLGPSTAIDGSLGKPVAGFLTERRSSFLCLWQTDYRWRIRPKRSERQPQPPTDSPCFAHV